MEPNIGTKQVLGNVNDRTFETEFGKIRIKCPGLRNPT
jgi:hypothetical protein